MKKKLLKLAALLLTVALVIVGTELAALILYPGNYITETWHHFYEKEKNSIDLLIVGSSHAYASLNPERIQERTGKSTYILASNSQNVTQTYFNVKEALKYQHPDTIILEAFSLNYDTNFRYDSMAGTDEYDKDWRKESNIDGMRLGIVKLQAIMEQYLPGNRAYALLKIARCHGNWTDLELIKKNCELLLKKDADYNGYNPSVTSMTEETALEYEQMEMDSGNYAISDENSRHFYKLADLCRKENIRLIVVMTPLYKGYADKTNYDSRHAAIAQLTDRAAAEFLDCQYAYDEIGLTREDFEDACTTYCHLNGTGADKVTEYVLNELEL